MYNCYVLIQVICKVVVENELNCSRRRKPKASSGGFTEDTCRDAHPWSQTVSHHRPLSGTPNQGTVPPSAGKAALPWELRAVEMQNATQAFEEYSGVSAEPEAGSILGRRVVLVSISLRLLKYYDQAQACMRMFPTASFITLQFRATKMSFRLESITVVFPSK